MTPSDVVRVTNEGFPSNTYVCRLSSPGRCIVIDPGLDTRGIQGCLDELGLEPVAVFCTHGHFDHAGSAELLRRRYGVPAFVRSVDRRLVARSNFTMMALGIPGRITPLEASQDIPEGEVWSDGADSVVAWHTPGHTSGSAVLSFGSSIFTGDTIYRDDTYLTPLPEHDLALLTRSVRSLWERIPDAATVLPGHGGSAPFGDIKVQNRALRTLLGMR